ncbi:MAG TPA: single-stranded DNA-binding protein [Acidobacteriaceae bacterium]
MLDSLNRAEIIGYLGADPEIRSLPEGGRVAGFSVATTDRWTDKASNKKRERTEWHRISIFNESLIKLAETYLHKGSEIYLAGQLQSRRWQDREGNEQYTTEIVLRSYNGTLTLLDGPREPNMPTTEGGHIRTPILIPDEIGLGTYYSVDVDPN